MRKNNILYIHKGIPYPSQQTLCAVLGITPGAFRTKVFRLGGMDELDEITIKGELITFTKL